MISTEREQITIAPDGRPADEQPRWRQDFPIDWPQDHYVARRDFTKVVVWPRCGCVAGPCWISIQNCLRERRGRVPLREIARLKQRGVGESLVFSYPEEREPCMLVRTGENRFRALGQKCT